MGLITTGKLYIYIYSGHVGLITTDKLLYIYIYIYIVGMCT